MPRSSPASRCPSTAATRPSERTAVANTSTEPIAAPLGDHIPTVLATYYDAIDGNRFADAAATFAPEGLYAVPLPGEVETAERAETVGPVALLARFFERGPKPWQPVVRLCVVEGRETPSSRACSSTTAATRRPRSSGSARVDEAGLLDRYLAFSCAGPPRPDPDRPRRRRRARRRRHGRRQLLHRPRRRPVPGRRGPLQRRRPLLASALQAHRHRRPEPDRVSRTAGAGGGVPGSGQGELRPRRRHLNPDRGPHCILRDLFIIVSVILHYNNY